MLCSSSWITLSLSLANSIHMSLNRYMQDGPGYNVSMTSVIILYPMLASLWYLYLLSFSGLVEFCLSHSDGGSFFK